MKLTKGIQYYFMFWTLYLPLSIVIALFFHHSLELFLAGIGIGAIGLFIFLFGRLLYLKIIKKKNLSSLKTEEIETSAELENFRTLFSEPQSSDGGSTQ